jgi:VanZ family protein
MGVIFWFSSIPGGSVPGRFAVVGHLGEYAILGALLTVALRSSGMRWRVAALLALAIASVYGISDELHQLFTPGRTCDPVDWLTDTAGAALGIAAVWALSRVVGGSRSRNAERTEN